MKGLPQEKKDHLKNVIGYSDAQIAAIDAVFTKAGTTAEESGRPTKEVTPVATGTVEVAKTEPPVVAETTEVVAKAADKEVTQLTAVEIAEAVGATLAPLLERLTFLETAWGTLAKEITTVKDAQDAAVANTIKATPALSLKELMNQQVYGNPAALVDGRSALAKDKPKETTDTAPQVTGIPFLDGLINVKNQAAYQQ